MFLAGLRSQVDHYEEPPAAAVLFWEVVRPFSLALGKPTLLALSGRRPCCWGASSRSGHFVLRARARARRIQTKPLSQGSSTSLSPPQSPSSCTLVAVVSGFACSCANTFAEFFNRLPRTRASCAKPELAAMVWPLAPRALPREHRGSQMGKSGPQRIFFPERVALKSFICCWGSLGIPPKLVVKQGERKQTTTMHWTGSIGGSFFVSFVFLRQPSQPLQERNRLAHTVNGNTAPESPASIHGCFSLAWPVCIRGVAPSLSSPRPFGRLSRGSRPPLNAGVNASAGWNFWSRWVKLCSRAFDWGVAAGFSPARLGGTKQLETW